MKRLFLFKFITIILLNNSVSATSDGWPWLKGGKHGDEIKLVALFLPKNPIILEAGSHRGEDTKILSKKWPEGIVYGFEPCPEYYSQLKKEVANLKNVFVFPFALFSSKGKRTFYKSTKWDGASSLFKDEGNGLDYHDISFEVMCVNLDDWAQENGVNAIHYMWLDMEGAELTALKSAPKILSTVQAISLEANFQEFRKGMAQFKDVKIFLENSGFYLYKIWGSKTGQATAVFIRKT